MSEFNRLWQQCVARAREAPPRSEEAPFGFATRVLAQANQPARTPASTLLWVRLGLRALGGVMALLLVLGTMEYHDSRDRGWTMPGVENCVAQAIWML